MSTTENTAQGLHVDDLPAFAVLGRTVEADGKLILVAGGTEGATFAVAHIGDTLKLRRFVKSRGDFARRPLEIKLHGASVVTGLTPTTDPRAYEVDELIVEADGTRA